MLINNYIDALPDAYSKGIESDNYKLLLLEQLFVQELRDDVQALDEVLDIHNATGKTLDLYGRTYKQARGALTDEQYRYSILQRVTRNMAQGDYNSIVNALSVAFGVPVTQIKFVETDKSAEVEMQSLPYSVLLEAGITVGQLRNIVLNILPAGIGLAPLNLEGSFEFGGAAMTYDEEKGFGNIEQTIGGYFGYLATDDIEIPE